MITRDFEHSRRQFLKIAALTAAAAPTLPAQPSPKAKYTRYNATSPKGKKALESYAKGVHAMLRLPATDPRNWFRNAFIHLMDCPHGNWWFYVWHRGYVGYFEETIRALSGDNTFAIPYWDWTSLPQIPDRMFDGVLTPRDHAFEPYTGNLAVFTALTKQPLTDYWNTLTPAQQTQLNTRGYTAFDKLWNDVTGAGVSGNMAYSNPCNARYLTRDNPKLDKATTYDTSPFIVYSGLAPTDFYNPNASLSFTSSKTPSHNSPAGSFSVLEGFPHNNVHNYIGGVGPLDPGPYGNMTNFLSPVDPIFFLHHANMDRLWDIWTRKQKAMGLPYLPANADPKKPAGDLKTLMDEPFLFYVKSDGTYVGPSTAGEYLFTERFDYDYEPGFGEDAIPPSTGPVTLSQTKPLIFGVVKANSASVSLPATAIRSHLAGARGGGLTAQVTVPTPGAMSNTRSFNVLVGAPPEVTQADPDSPYYAGTIAFFGKMTQMSGMAHDATFAVPLPRSPRAFGTLSATATSASINIRVVPAQSGSSERPPAVKALRVQML